MTDYKKIAVALWKLLDDIDTAVDAFKPTMTPYSRFVCQKVGERFKHITSDGYILTDPATGERVDG